MFSLEGRCRDIREIRLQESCQTSASLSQRTGGWRGAATNAFNKLEAHIFLIAAPRKYILSMPNNLKTKLGGLKNQRENILCWMAAPKKSKDHTRQLNSLDANNLKTKPCTLNPPEFSKR